MEFQHKALKIEKKNQNIVLAEENNSNYDKFKQKLTLLTPPQT